MGGFYFGIGVAQVYAYKIYVTMWEEENKKGRMDLPKKWTHGEFIEQLVYEMMLPQQTEIHRDLLLCDKEGDDATSLNRSLSLLTGCFPATSCVPKDVFTHNIGINSPFLRAIHLFSYSPQDGTSSRHFVLSPPDTDNADANADAAYGDKTASHPINPSIRQSP